MKSRWSTQRLEDLADLVQYGYTSKSSDSNVGPKYLRITDIVPDMIDWSEVPHVELSDSDLDKYLLQPGDIVVARTGATVGYAKLVREPPEAVFASYLVRFRAGERVDPFYVGYVVESDDYKQYVRANAGGTAQPNANARVLGSYEIPLPPLEIQRIIGAFLSSIDLLIANNKRRTEILEELARAIYRHWFVEFKYPGHEGVPLVESELGPIPKGWEVRALGDVAKVNANSVMRGNEPDSILYVDISSVSTGRIDSTTPMKFSEAPSRARRLVSAGDTIWSTVRPNRRSYAFMSSPPAEMVVSTGFAVLTPESVGAAWLYRATTTDEFADYLSNRATGSAYPAVNAGVFKDAPMLVPKMSLMDRFENIVNSMLKMADTLEAMNVRLREARDLLVPKLLSGELDVSELDIGDAA